MFHVQQILHQRVCVDSIHLSYKTRYQIYVCKHTKKINDETRDVRSVRVVVHPKMH